MGFTALAQSISVYDASKTYKAGDVVLPITENGICGCVDKTWKAYLEDSKIKTCTKKNMLPRKPKPAQSTISKGDVAKHINPLKDILNKHSEVLDDHESRLTNVETKVSDIEGKLASPTTETEPIQENLDTQIEYSVGDVNWESETENSESRDSIELKVWNFSPYPFLGWNRDANPSFNSKNIFYLGICGEADLFFTAFSNDKKLEKFFVYADASYVSSLNAVNLADNTESALPLNGGKAKIIHGLILGGGLGCYFLPNSKIFLGYKHSFNPGLAHKGLNAGVELGLKSLKKFPLKLRCGIFYKDCLIPYADVLARFHLY